MRRGDGRRESEFTVNDTFPSVSEYQRLRGETSWCAVSDDDVRVAFEGSLYAASAWSSDGLLRGFGRVVGDRAMYVYFQDVIVQAEYRHLGIGKAIINRLLTRIHDESPRAFVGLMAATGSLGFYKRLGFEARPPSRPGMSLDQRPHR